MESDDAVAALGALAHPGRLAVLRLLVHAGADGLAAGEIARRLDVPANSLSANLAILHQVELVASRRRGRSIIYTVGLHRMAALLGYLVEDCCQGAPALCAPLTRALDRLACTTA